MSHGRWWGSLLPLNHLRTAASPCSRWFPLNFQLIRQFRSGHGMAIWASILQPTTDTRHLHRFTKEIHQKKAKSMVFKYSKYLLEFNKISPIPNWKKPKVAYFMSRTSTAVKLGHSIMGFQGQTASVSTGLTSTFVAQRDCASIDRIVLNLLVFPCSW